jgi:hypothetical protein
MLCCAAAITLSAQSTWTTAPAVRRFDQSPLVTVQSSPTLGGNVNGPTVIRVPSWVEHPRGRYYMYFANHMGDFIRLAYADQLAGPWRIYEPGVLHARDTAFFREQPDPPEALDDFYTHVASPEIYVDAERRRFVMWVHGWWTNGERWPPTLQAARQWARQRGYGQFTQAAESADGLHFVVRPAISRTSYLRVFQYRDVWYGISRLGLVSRAHDPLASFEQVGNIFAGTPHAGKVRHVALILRGDRLAVFFTRIGDAPERVMMSSVNLGSDPAAWRSGAAVDVLAPSTKYECADLPEVPSEAGDISVPAKQIRDPFLYQENGRSYLFYSTCGEQGIAAAEVDLR